MNFAYLDRKTGAGSDDKLSIAWPSLCNQMLTVESYLSGSYVAITALYAIPIDSLDSFDTILAWEI